MRCILVAVALSLAGSSTGAPVEPAVPVEVRTNDGTLHGQVTDRTAEQLTLQLEGGDTKVVHWDALPVTEVYRLHQLVMDRADARQWLDLARLLGRRTEGATLADTSLKVAVLLDESVTEEAEVLRAQWPQVASGASPGPLPPPAAASEATELTTPSAEADRAGEDAVWGDVTPANRHTFIDIEQSFAQDVSNTLDVTFNLVETDFFLFYTDLPPKEAYEWQRVLDLMYERVGFLLGIPEGVNVFRGKATVFLFARKEDFTRFEQRFYGRNVTYEAGICHQHDTGEVRIAFYRIEDEKYLRQLMIHEAAHGVVHRYRSPTRVPDWFNEGVAEWTASAVLHYDQPFKWKKQASAQYIRQRGGNLDDAYFEDGEFKAEYYGTALAMTEILLRGGRPRFHEFVNTIKDGSPWPVAMQDVYDLSVDDLVREYLSTIGIRQPRR